MFGIWLISPPKQQSAQASSPEVTPKPSPVTTASSRSSNEQGESPVNSNSEEELRKELMEAQTEIFLLKLKLQNSEGELLLVKLQKSEIEQIKLMIEMEDLKQSTNKIYLRQLEPETKKRFEKRNLK